MIVIKRTKTKTDIINLKDKKKIYLEIGENIVDDKYKEELMNSILFKTSGIQILEDRKEAIGSISVEAKNAEADELEALRKEAKELGLTFHPTMGKVKLLKAIEAKKAETPSVGD